MAGLGWYGPLIDLTRAYFHVDDYVQLIAFVHRSNPVQYKLSKGGSMIRTDIHVGDDTRPFFSVSLWNKRFASTFSAGDIILLQNVKVTKFGKIVEARTVQYSSILCLIHPFDSILSKGMDDLMANCRVGGTVKEKLRRVIEWVQRTRSTLCNELKGDQEMPTLRNWKVQEEHMSCTCYLLSQVLRLANPCNAIFHASIGEIFLPHAPVSDLERMFMSRQLVSRRDAIVEDMICMGCQLCGSPLCLDSRSEQKTGPLYCEKSSNRLHTVGLIYRPFMLYVWDNTDHIPLTVNNKAAELLFASIKAESVYQSYKEQKNYATPMNHSKVSSNVHACGRAEKEVTECVGTTALSIRDRSVAVKRPNFYLIWLILLKTLLLQGKNSPLRFKAVVSPNLEIEDGRFEMTCVSMPYLGSHISPAT